MHMQIENILHFLTELKQNNNREWFAENKSWYLKIKNDFEKLVGNLILELSKFDENIKHIEVKDCVFRIYRDTRFSPDKTPYKTHFGAYIAPDGGRKSPRGGYYLHLDPDGSFLAVGIWCPEPAILKALRKSVYENIDELNEIRREINFAKYFTSFDTTDELKKTPAGFPKDFLFPELLRLRHYIVNCSLDNSILNLDSEKFNHEVALIMKYAYPLNCFLNYTVDELISKH